ncbi:unnamed protein product [Ixodes persulcatus]
MGEESPVLSLASSGTLRTKSCTTVAVVGSGNNPYKGRTQVVLDEDAYTAAIGKIIERDFFPDVPKLRAQNEYLDALEANNITRLRELQEKYQHRSGPRSGLHARVPLTEEERRERGPGRAIAHEHTRLERAPFDERVNRETLAQAAGVQAKALEGKVGVDGRELQGQESPKVGGFGFVATPSPAPGVSESPLLTWGEIEGTPFLLDGSDTPLPRHPGGPQFRIPEPRSRERLALSLADGVARRSAARRSAALDQMRSSFLSPGASPSPKTPLARLGTMSPAARHLASAKLGISKGVDRALRASYTPGHTPVREKDGGLAATPTPSPLLPSPASSRRSTRKDGNPEEASSLTDNLLRLPLKRKAAADFF